MADPSRFFGNPVDLLLAPKTARWPLWSMMALGLWLTIAPFSHGWRDEADLVQILFTGLGAFGLALFCRLYSPMAYLSYLNAFAGVWLMAGDLLFSSSVPIWAGPALLSLSLVIPVTSTQPLSDAPPAWFHNPSTWVQRLPLAVLLTFGALVARGSRSVAAFLLIALTMALIGDRRRWRTAPWAVCLSVGSIAAAAVVSATWLALEPGVFAVGALVASLLAGVLSLDEILAMRLMLRHAPQLGQFKSDAFWNGGVLPYDDLSPRPNRRPAWAPPKSLRRRHSRRGKVRRPI